MSKELWKKDYFYTRYQRVYLELVKDYGSLNFVDGIFWDGKDPVIRTRKLLKYTIALENRDWQGYFIPRITETLTTRNPESVIRHSRNVKFGKAPFHDPSTTEHEGND